uniref:Minor capsid protein P11 C-terminal conserved region domain-containing protein n=1 Tax=viral metagenome TaxID=1070528 RepID=A0A6C0IXL5_9ZZZZ
MKIGLILVLGLVLVYLIYLYTNKNNDSIENFDENNLEEDENENGDYNIRPSEAVGNNATFDELENSNNSNALPNDCFPKDKLNPSDLLPGDSNSKWAEVNPAGQGSIGDQNFLDAGHHVGVNTVGQTLRNANLQIRSEPPNPQVKVSPWLQTTIEPDSNRQPIEIGGCQ